MDGSEYVREQPFELRYYPALDLTQLYSPLLDRLRGEGLPLTKRVLVEEVKKSIEKDGMRNPLTVEWFAEYQCDPSKETWSVRIGNNRLVALLELDRTTAPCLVIVPDGMDGPAGTYETLDFMSALARFDAAHPWWHSYILRLYRPDLVPRAA